MADSISCKWVEKDLLMSRPIGIILRKTLIICLSIPLWSYNKVVEMLGFDPSFISKSGNKTPELGMFYSGCASRCKKGLEIGGLAVIDLHQHTAYHLEAIQTPSSFEDMTLVDYYAKLILDRATALTALSRILVVDGYFAKQNFVIKKNRRKGIMEV